MKIINIILLIFQRSSGDFYYISQQGNCGPESERVDVECQARRLSSPGPLLFPRSMIN